MKIFLAYNHEVIVDDADFYRVEGKKWCLNKGKLNNNWYVMHGVRYGKKVKKVYLHRLIANAGPGDRIEFINGNTFDCQRHNLRINGKRLKERA